MDVCEVCANAKEEQKIKTHLSQWHGKSTIFNEEVYCDLSFINDPNQRDHTIIYGIPYDLVEKV